MPQVGLCPRRLLIVFNIFFVIAQGLVIVVSLVGLRPLQDDSHAGSDFEPEATSGIVLYIADSVTMVIAILGAYGAYKRNLVALTAYWIFMVIGSLLMLRLGVPAAIARPKLESLMEERWRSFLPLDKASVDIKNQAEALQTSLHCCGLFSYEDWGQNIPDSCLCNLDEETAVNCQTADYRNFLLNFFWQKKSVLKQHCLPLMMDFIIRNANISLGLLVTRFVLALLGVVLSSLTICWISSTLPSVPVMFGDQPPAYQQLYNLPEEAAVAFRTKP